MTGTCILVTGGTRGIGLHLCKELLEAGASVITTARQASPEVTGLQQRFSQQFTFIPCDLSNNQHIQGFIESANLLTTRLNGFVANAAVGTEGILTLMTPVEIQRSLQVNLQSTILLTQAVLKSMLAQEISGSLVFISSACAHHGFKGLSVYAAAKAGLCGFSKALAREYGNRGIRSNTVLPGFIDTDMTQSLSKAQRASIQKRTSLNRLGSCEDVTRTVLHLLSDDARYITGAELVVDGGLTT